MSIGLLSKRYFKGADIDGDKECRDSGKNNVGEQEEFEGSRIIVDGI